MPTSKLPGLPPGGFLKPKQNRVPSWKTTASTIVQPASICCSLRNVKISALGKFRGGSQCPEALPLLRPEKTMLYRCPLSKASPRGSRVPRNSSTQGAGHRDRTWQEKPFHSPSLKGACGVPVEFLIAEDFCPILTRTQLRNKPAEYFSSLPLQLTMPHSLRT